MAKYLKFNLNFKLLALCKNSLSKRMYVWYDYGNQQQTYIRGTTMTSNLLTTNFKLPLLLPHTDTYNIYIDESIAFNPDNKSGKFIVSFCAFPKDKISLFNKEYFFTIYTGKTMREIKSTSVSDKRNCLALRIAQKYLTAAQIFQYQYAPINKKSANLAFELRCYILPLEQLIQKLRDQSEANRVLCNIFIDQTSQNNASPYQEYNQQLLNSIAQKLSTEQQLVDCSYNTLDSKESYGIQAADMLAGAYRKELTYQENSDPTQIIPFSYNRQVISFTDFSEDQDFLKLLGLIAYNNVFTEEQDKIKPINTPKVNLDIIFKVKIALHKLFYEKILFGQNATKKVVNQTLKNLDLALNVADSYSKEQIILRLSQLNEILYKSFKPNTPSSGSFIRTLSKKNNEKHFKKTIANISKNIIYMNSIDLSASQRQRFVKALKSFNANIGVFLQ